MATVASRPAIKPRRGPELATLPDNRAAVSVDTDRPACPGHGAVRTLSDPVGKPDRRKEQGEAGWRAQRDAVTQNATLRVS